MVFIIKGCATIVMIAIIKALIILYYRMLRVKKIQQISNRLCIHACTSKSACVHAAPYCKPIVYLVII